MYMADLCSFVHEGAGKWSGNFRDDECLFLFHTNGARGHVHGGKPGIGQCAFAGDAG